MDVDKTNLEVDIIEAKGATGLVSIEPRRNAQIAGALRDERGATACWSLGNAS
jgi:hypothetical protein